MDESKQCAALTVAVDDSIVDQKEYGRVFFLKNNYTVTIS